MTRFLRTARAVVVGLAAIGGVIAFPMRASAISLNPCLDTYWTTWQHQNDPPPAGLHSFTMRNPEYDFITGDYPIDSGNVPFSVGDGIASWNIFRNSGGCTWTGQPINGHHFNLVATLANVNPFNLADNTNTVGFIDFRSPPGDSNIQCRDVAMSDPINIIALTCIHAPGNLVQDWGIAFNVSGYLPLTTNQSKPQPWIYIQAVMTHEGGHTMGLGHARTNYKNGPWNNNDTDAQLTMYPWYNRVTDRGNYWYYTLGQGDITGAQAQTTSP